MCRGGAWGCDSEVNMALQNHGIQRCPHCVPAPGPLKLVQAASLSPAGLESGMDDRIASFAP